MHVCLYVCMSVCLYVCMSVCMHVHIYIYIYTHTYIHMLACSMSACVCVCRVHLHMSEHIGGYDHTHISMCTLFRSLACLAQSPTSTQSTAACRFRAEVSFFSS